MSMQGYDTTTWPQLYLAESDFSAIYQQLHTNKLSTTNYFLKDNLVYKLGKFCVPTGEHRYKLIWDTHYRKTTGHLGVTKTLVILQNYFY